MTTPRVEVDLAKVTGNARSLVARLAARGIGVTGVTKGVGSHPAIARAMLAGGVTRLADARVSGLERMRAAGIDVPMALIRTPMLSQVDRVVRVCDVSLNTEADVIDALARAARRTGRRHGIVLMVELGDGREGIRPAAIRVAARKVAATDGVVLHGLGANFACLSGRPPDRAAMAMLSSLAMAVEAELGLPLATISGGGSSSLPWALGSRGPSRIDDLRLGEAILLGLDPVSGAGIDGLATDAFAIVAEVIETVAAPGPLATPRPDCGREAILALGHLDVDINGLVMPDRLTRIGATSDHLVVTARGPALAVGDEIGFRPSYAALARAMTAPDMTVVAGEGLQRPPTVQPHRCDSSTWTAA
ncbi:alanine racemase [uncultured Jannaschia sp.]|uniref:alanine racemase n=1 Tax=uncultured Jannaschia sp. TaxID=293347 RepID=UPI00262ABAB8|nr:alanine racemase [uncultured Jannaschia sp.]